MMMRGIYNQLNVHINNTVKRSRFYPLPRDLCFPAERPVLKRWASGKKNLVEIGVFEGASGSLFRSVMDRNAVLHLIDPFIPDSMNPSLQARMWMARINLARVRRGQVKWYKDYSYNVVKTWDEGIDFLFIDGDHTEKSCLQDWQSWSPFVQAGGVAIFHDARYGSSEGKFWDGWEGPTRVVNRLFREKERLKGWTIVDEAGTAVAVQRA